MTEPFELFFTEGFAATWHARHHGDLERDFAWGSLDASQFEPSMVERARLAWTQQTLSEYGTSVSMAQLVEALARASAPIDLIAMASHFVTQELTHAELYARLTTRLGGGTPLRFDPASLGAAMPADLTAHERATALVVQLCCIGETFSMPMLAAGLQVSDHPLVRSVLERVVAEESVHGRLGWLYLDWVGDELTDGERERLGRMASKTLADLSRQWPTTDTRLAQGVPLTQLNRLGWVDPGTYRRRATEVILEHVIRPLSKYGIIAGLGG